jgi:hypothetical protein
MLSEDISEIQFGTTVFQVTAASSIGDSASLYTSFYSDLHLFFIFLQKMIAVGLPTKMHTIRVLVLGSVGPNLDADAVVNFLKCFPCLETLYVIVSIKYSCLLYMSKSTLELYVKSS